MAEPMERTAALIMVPSGGEAGLAAALDGMGATLPAPGHFTEAAGLLLARTVPGQVFAMRNGTHSLLDELAPLDAIARLIDLSDARIGIRIAGPNAADTLARLLPIDLDPSRFKPGQCANTLMAHLSVLVLQHAAADYELQCSRSFAGSFLRAIEAAA